LRQTLLAAIPERREFCVLWAPQEREREHGREELRGEGRETEYREAEADPDDINNRTLKKTQNATKHLKQ
jgi:hypothetical protein